MVHNMRELEKPPIQIPANVYHEILIWLRRQNERKRGAFLDRPFTVTILGGVAAALLTAWWQAAEKRSEQVLTYQRALISEEITLLKDLAATYENTGQIVNGWFTRVIWIAQESNKPKTADTDKNIAQWKDEAQKLEQALGSASPLDRVLAPVSALYRCQSVKDNAARLQTTWNKYLDTFQTFNRHWNDTQQLPNPEIEAAENSRKTQLAESSDLNDSLIKRMGAEISTAHNNLSNCPP